MSAFDTFSTYITDNAESIAIEAVEAILQKFNEAIPFEEKERAIHMFIGFLKFFGKALVQEEPENVPSSFIDWSKKNAEMQVASGGKISKIVIRYQPTRTVFTDILTRIGKMHNVTTEENTTLIKLFNYILDIGLNETVYAFEQLAEEFKKKTELELLTLSAPIVPVKEGVVVLPLVGAMDDQRVRAVMENVIPRISDMKIDYVIVDFSGLLKIDPHVAMSLHQIGNILRLMGIVVIFTGLRPDLVQVSLNSGIDMSAVRTHATVKQALETLR